MRTIELRVLCEGQTEQNFVARVLRPHLRSFGVYATGQRLVRAGQGGVVPWEKFRQANKVEIGRSKAHQHVTTMIDLYGLGDYPGAEHLQGESVATRVDRIQSCMRQNLPSPQFIPYIQVHEFETLVFVDLDELIPSFPDDETQVRQAIAELKLGSASLRPEEIDDGPDTAPSKRLLRAIPAYANAKPIAGPEIAGRIGLERLRASCPHLDVWITRLEGLAKEDPSRMR